MYYIYKDNHIEVDRKELDIYRTLSSGQLFRYEKLTDNIYILFARDRYVKLEQLEDSSVIYPVETEDLPYWTEYFDLEMSYEKIMRSITTDDRILESAYVGNEGIRILRQDLYETILSFIVSQNNNIPRIKKIISGLCERYGNRISYDEGYYFSFPDTESLQRAGIEDLRAIGLGYRAEYIYSACRTLSEGYLQTLKEQDPATSYRSLLDIYGIGPKVANCITLFGLHDLTAFPVDTWIKKVLHVMYGVDNSRETSKVIDRYGQYAGIAQQYLFYYARNNQKLFSEMDV